MIVTKVLSSTIVSGSGYSSLEGWINIREYFIYCTDGVAPPLLNSSFILCGSDGDFRIIYWIDIVSKWFINHVEWTGTVQSHSLLSMSARVLSRHRSIPVTWFGGLTTQDARQQVHIDEFILVKAPNLHYYQQITTESGKENTCPSLVVSNPTSQELVASNKDKSNRSKRKKS
jgi:hypothetical protein